MVALLGVVFFGLLTWGPSYLAQARGFDIKGIGAATFPLPSPKQTVVPLHDGIDAGEIIPGSDEDHLFRTNK